MATLCAETNVILKLDLGGKGGIRRIALAKLWEPTTSRVSYQRLSEMALEYSNLSETNAMVSSIIKSESKLPRVTVTYTDEDGDSITVSTDDELTDAFEQFATRVPPIIRAKASFEVKKDAKKIVERLKKAISDIDDTVKEGEGGNTKPKVELMQGVLDSFLTMLTQAVDSLSKNVEGMQQRKKCCNKAVPKEVRARNMDHKPNSVLKRREAAKNLKELEKDKTKDEDVPPVVKKKQEKYGDILPMKAELDKRFIHGRHTCDGCLVAPIIGIRYHAINLPDHDLCEKCVLKHTRKDIIFEPTELERDRCIQNKWKRRQWAQNREVKERCGRQRHSVMGKFEVCSADTALKEAIRRSLQYTKPKPEEKEESKVKKPSVKDEEIVESLEKDYGEKTTKDGEEVDAETIVEQTGDVEVKKDESSTKELILANMEDNETKDEEDVDAEIIVEQNIGDSENVSHAEVDLSVLKLQEELSVDITPISQETKKANEPSLPEGDVAFDIGVDLDATANDSNTNVSEVGKPITTNRDDVSEESSQTKSYVTANGTDTVVSKEEKPLGDTTLECQTQAGCTILGTVNTANSNGVSEESSQTQASVDSNNEWQILDEDGQSTSDEMIAQATQLLGSALFQSDVISDVTEVKEEYTMPTNQRIISGPILSRWDAELNQLHELGFLDDTKNVFAIEQLEAASVRQGSNHAVMVNDVVDYLLSKYNEQY